MKRTLWVLTVWFALLPANLWASDLLVDHVEYVRETGVAQEMSLFFPGCDPQGTYTLTVTNGQDDAHRATAGSVTVNVVEIVNATDFTQSPAPAVITKTINGVGERNTLALSVTAPQRSIIGWRVTADVTCPEITIDNPPPNSVINRGETAVSGRVRHRTPEVGVKVNGVLAQVNGNHWAVNEVPLNAGGNTLNVEAIDDNGQTATNSLIVSRPDSIPGGIKLRVYGESGIVPLDASFTVTNASGKTISQYVLDFGDGTTATVAETVEYAHRYESEGVFQVVARGTDADGIEHLDQAAVSIHAPPPLKTRWEKMKAALAQGNTAQALVNFTEQEARVQEQIFQALGSRALTMIEQMQDIERVYLEGDQAQYRIRRNELVDGAERPITYYIQFVRNEDGFWKIDSY